MSRFTLLIPVRNEAENVGPLHDEITRLLAGQDYGVVVINDGSTDETAARLAEHPGWHVISTPPQGKSRALEAGLAQVTTGIVVTLDGDLQDDTAAIPDLVAEVEHGAACAVGCRVRRDDHWLMKRLPSRCFNLFIQAVFGRHFHDVNSGLKAFQVSALRRIRWFDGCHRFLPLLIWRAGGRVVEWPTVHRPRRRGVGKFNSPLRGVVAVGQALLIAAGYYDPRG
jgi:dolichol-phosphate mannosyltransferase